MHTRPIRPKDSAVRCIMAKPGTGEYATQLVSTPRTTDQAMGISRQEIRQANGSAYFNDLRRKDNERGKRANGCAHQAGKRRDGNLMRCIGCDKVVGLWCVPQAAARRAVRRPNPVLPVVFDMDDPNSPLAAIQFALDRLFRPEVRTSKRQPRPYAPADAHTRRQPLRRRRHA
jgi:hypothetical protein